MRCPTCDTLLPDLDRTCPNCATTLTADDWLNLHKLHYLLGATVDWTADNLAERRAGYVDSYAEARAALRPQPVATPSPAQPAAAVAVPPNDPAQAAAPRPSFEAWLFSERTIRTILYSGAFLLILAGLIFVGARWSTLAWWGKLAVTLATTALMLVSGLLLLGRARSLRVGGLALVTIAAGFAPLNFAVVHLYLLADQGVDERWSWQVGAIGCFVFYVWLLRRTRAELIAYFCIAAAYTGYVVLLWWMEPDGQWLLPVLLLPSLAMLRLAWFWQATRYLRRPLLIAAHLIIAPLFALSIFTLLIADATRGLANHPVWASVTLLLTALFLGLIGRRNDNAPYRWLALTAATPAPLLLLYNLDASPTLLVGAALLQAVGYLAGALRVTAYRLQLNGGTAALILVALNLATDDQLLTAVVMLVAVALLVVAAWQYEQERLLLPAALLLPLPTALFADTAGLQPVAIGAVLFGLLVLYIAGSRRPLLRCALLVGALPLPLAIVALSGTDSTVAFLLAVASATLLLLPSRLYGAWLQQFGRGEAQPAYFLIGYAILLLLTGNFQLIASLNASGRSDLVAVAVLIGVLVLSVAAALAPWLRAALLPAAAALPPTTLALGELGELATFMVTAGAAMLALFVAWQQRHWLRARWRGLPAAYAAALLFVGHFYLLAYLSERPDGPWQPIAVSLASTFVLIGLLLRGERWREIYGRPLNLMGYLLLPAVVLLTLARGQMPPAQIVAISSVIAAVAAAVDGLLRRDSLRVYLATALFLLAWSSTVIARDWSEFQLHALPLGIALLAIGWWERRRGHTAPYLLLSFFGLSVLFSSAFVQSLDDVRYAVLLLVESVLAIGWGVRTRSRGYVQAGIAALIFNAVAQIGPAYVELPRFLQIGIIGSLLLLGGLLALLRREQLLATRARLRAQWRQWEY